jgi:DNA-directed RNA polymerase specialized sigma24 family protein
MEVKGRLNGMSEEVETLSIEEVGRLLGRLRQPDLLRLAALARTWVIGLPRRDPKDLLSEALARILSGDRPWPAHVSFSAFLSQVMRSIASHWRHEDQREPLADDGGEGLHDRAPPVDHEYSDLTERMRATLEDDTPARDMLDHVLLQTSRKEARAQLGLDETGYDTTRRRMIRSLQRQFNPGWKL